MPDFIIIACVQPAQGYAPLPRLQIDRNVAPFWLRLSGTRAGGILTGLPRSSKCERVSGSALLKRKSERKSGDPGGFMLSLCAAAAPLE